MHTTKIDEFLIIFSNVNINTTIKAIKKKLKIKISKDEINFYMKYHKLNKISKKLIFYYYAKYFNGFRDLNLIKKRQYVLLMLIMKKRLEAKGYIYLNQIISANIKGKVSTRTIRNSKFLEKVSTSSVYQNLIKNKYASLEKMGHGDEIINILSSIINTDFVMIDYYLPEHLGEDIGLDLETISEECLDFINQI